jgi:maltose O-acetyltransferase
MFGPNVTIRGGNHRIDVIGEYMINVRDKLYENDVDVKINDDVWVGCNTTILTGVEVGRGSVIGAGSVVTRSIPPYTIYVGNKNRTTYDRFDTNEIKLHEKQLKENKNV